MQASLSAALARVAGEVESALDDLLPPGDGRRGPAARGDALRHARRRQASAGISGDGSAALFGVTPLRRPRRAPPSKCCTPIRWCMTICRRWTTTICGAAGRALPQGVRRGDRDPGRRCAADPRVRGLAEPDTHSDPEARCELVAALAAAAGARGMVGGQMIDMLAEGKALTAGR